MTNLDGELSPRLNKLINPVVFAERVIWFAIAGSILFYSAIAYVIVGDGGPPAEIGGFEVVIYSAALAAAIASVMYRRRALSDERVLNALNKGKDIVALAADPRSKSVDEERLTVLRSLDGFERGAYALMFELQKITFISLFLNELVVILGFVLAFLSGDPYKIIPFGLIALVLSVWMFPKPGSMIKRARAIYKG